MIHSIVTPIEVTVARRNQLMRQLWGCVCVGAGGGVLVSLPLGSQKDIPPEFQVAGASATVTPVMSRWLVTQLWASNVSVVFFISGVGGEASAKGGEREREGGGVTGWRSIGKCPHSSVAHPRLEIYSQTCTCTPSANPPQDGEENLGQCCLTGMCLIAPEIVRHAS